MGSRPDSEDTVQKKVTNTPFVIFHIGYIEMFISLRYWVTWKLLSQLFSFSSYNVNTRKLKIMHVICLTYISTCKGCSGPTSQIQTLLFSFPFSYFFSVASELKMVFTFLSGWKQSKEYYSTKHGNQKILKFQCPEFFGAHAQLNGLLTVNMLALTVTVGLSGLSQKTICQPLV